MNPLVIFILVLIAIPLDIWITMIMFGVVHSFLPIIPAFGFWQTAAIIVLKNLLFPSFSGRPREGQ